MFHTWCAAHAYLVRSTCMALQALCYRLPEETDLLDVGESIEAGASLAACRLKLAMGANNQALTPQCGACAPGVADADPKAYNASMSGLAYVSSLVAPSLTLGGVAAAALSKLATRLAPQCATSVQTLHGCRPRLQQQQQRQPYESCYECYRWPWHLFVPPISTNRPLSFLVQVCQPGHAARQCLCKL